jgi:hypothetical protein
MVGVSLRDQMEDNRYSVCCNGLCYGHRRAWRRYDDGEPPLLENDAPRGFQNHTGLVAMTIDFAGVTDGDDDASTTLANDIAARIEKDHADLVRDLNATGIVPNRFIQIVLDYVEVIGGYDLTDYDEDDDGFDDDDDDFEDEDDEEIEDVEDLDDDDDEDARAGMRFD